MENIFNVRILLSKLFSNATDVIEFYFKKHNYFEESVLKNYPPAINTYNNINNNSFPKHNVYRSKYKRSLSSSSDYSEDDESDNSDDSQKSKFKNWKKSNNMNNIQKESVDNRRILTISKIDKEIQAHKQDLIKNLKTCNTKGEKRESITKPEELIRNSKFKNLSEVENALTNIINKNKNQFDESEKNQIKKENIKCGIAYNKPEKEKQEEKEEGVKAQQSQSSFNQNTCTICFDEMKQRAILNRCSHQYCYECIRQWSDNSNKCPLCKAEYMYIIYFKNKKRIREKVKIREFLSDGYSFTFDEDSLFPSSGDDSESMDDEDKCILCNDDSQRNMIYCDACEVYCCHQACCNLSDYPEEEWYCPNCLIHFGIDYMINYFNSDDELVSIDKIRRMKANQFVVEYIAKKIVPRFCGVENRFRILYNLQTPSNGFEYEWDDDRTFYSSEFINKNFNSNDNSDRDSRNSNISNNIPFLPNSNRNDQINSSNIGNNTFLPNSNRNNPINSSNISNNTFLPNSNRNNPINSSNISHHTFLTNSNRNNPINSRNISNNTFLPNSNKNIPINSINNLRHVLKYPLVINFLPEFQTNLAGSSNPTINYDIANNPNNLNNNNSNSNQNNNRNINHNNYNRSVFHNSITRTFNFLPTNQLPNPFNINNNNNNNNSSNNNNNNNNNSNSNIPLNNPLQIIFNSSQKSSNSKDYSSNDSHIISCSCRSCRKLDENYSEISSYSISRSGCDSAISLENYGVDPKKVLKAIKDLNYFGFNINHPLIGDFRSDFEPVYKINKNNTTQNIVVGKNKNTNNGVKEQFLIPATSNFFPFSNRITEKIRKKRSKSLNEKTKKRNLNIEERLREDSEKTIVFFDNLQRRKKLELDNYDRKDLISYVLAGKKSPMNELLDVLYKSAERMCKSVENKKIFVKK